MPGPGRARCSRDGQRLSWRYGRQPVPALARPSENEERQPGRGRAAVRACCPGRLEAAGPAEAAAALDEGPGSASSHTTLHLCCVTTALFLRPNSGDGRRKNLRSEHRRVGRHVRSGCTCRGSTTPWSAPARDRCIVSTAPQSATAEASARQSATAGAAQLLGECPDAFGLAGVLQPVRNAAAPPSTPPRRPSRLRKWLLPGVTAVCTTAGLFALVI